MAKVDKLIVMCVTVRASQSAWLNKLADKLQTSKSAVIRQIIQKAMESDKHGR